MKLAAIHICTWLWVMVSILSPQAAAVCCSGVYFGGVQGVTVTARRFLPGASNLKKGRCCGAHRSGAYSVYRSADDGCNIFCCNCDGGKCLGQGMTDDQRAKAARLALWRSKNMFEYMEIYQYGSYEERIHMDGSDQKWKAQCFDYSNYRPFIYWNEGDEARILFSRGDINGDEFISIEEAEIFFEKQYHHNGTSLRRRVGNFWVGEEIKKMDRNQDGVLSPSEFDESLRD